MPALGHPSVMPTRIRSLAAFAALCASFSVAALAQEAAPAPDEGDAAPAAPAKAEHPPKADADIAKAPVKEARAVTHHTITVDGKPIAYDATAGTLTLRDNEGKPTASMFYVAYVVDSGPGDHSRPVTFFYNGGPGSASVWLHLGSFGPVRIVTDAPESTPGPPFKLETNEDTLLGKSDLVFLDAIGTGYSRTLGDTKDDKYWGVDQDIDAFARGITRYVTLNNRWNSPKFLFGESYGTPRTAGLVYALQTQGMQFNGVTILSTILNFGVRNRGFDREFVSYLPTYAAAAWYHGKVNPKPADLEAFLREVRAYAAGPYLLALDKGQNLPADEEEAVARKVSSYTGLSVTFLRQNHLRVRLSRFRKELLRDEHRTIGRYDSRFLAIDADDAGEAPEIDPSADYSAGPFVGAFHDYVTTQLSYHTDLDYRLHGIDTNKKWDWHHKAPGDPEPSTDVDMALDLAAALRDNPHLQVLSLNGWYDMATPFFQTEYDLDHMLLDPSLKDHVHLAYYPSGHMVYLNPEALKLMKADVARFYDLAAP
jgi:carboxypeptidase C (cathepsin A)